LAVDTDLDIRTVLADVLATSGYDVTTAQFGSQALHLAAQHRPDVVLLDCEVRQVPAAAVVAAFQSTPTLAHIPLVLVTPGANRPHDVAGLTVAGVLAKPFNLWHLLHALTGASPAPAGAPECATVEAGAMP
jgi:DNA-binding response OmpR family regulator